MEDEKKIQHGLDFHRQLVKTSTDYALKTLTALFLLNGSAATAILAAKNTKLYSSGLFFAMGALAAIIALGLAYFANSEFAASWSPEQSQEFRARAENRADKYVRLACYAAIAGGALFFIGLVLGAPELLCPTPQ